jgi:general nucleoside transport system ATP-binding protein
MKRISKRFGQVAANKNIDFVVFGGEVHALLGENGAGKSTLMNILYGLYRADSGKIFVRGKSVEIRSPKDAIALKIAMVHQHFELVSTLTVSENVGLGLGSNKHPLMALEEVAKRINKLAETYGLQVNPELRIEQLSVGERQRVEIVKALYREPDLLILDEPTSVLTPQEAEGLFKFIRSMAAEGRGVVVITHKLPEVIEVSDTVTVLRHGEVVARLETKGTNPDELAEKMVGRTLSHLVSGSQEVHQPMEEELLLEVKGVTARNDKGAVALDNISFQLRKGEILGIAGVAGNGQTELEEVLAGMRKITSGEIVVDGKSLTNSSPKAMIEHGVGGIPEDRIGSGLVLDMSIAENLVLETRQSQRYQKRHMIDERAIHENARALVEEFSISCGSVDSPARTLSGGNMQKLILAKTLSRRPKVLVAAQPTSGLDVGSTEFIDQKLKEQRKQGVGILLISTDLNEVMTLSDRIACISEGKIMGIVPASEARLEEIGLMIGGVAKK